MEKHQEKANWDQLSYQEKNHQLYLRQKKLLETFLEHRAISQEDYEKSLHDLTVKMCEDK